MTAGKRKCEACGKKGLGLRPDRNGRWYCKRCREELQRIRGKETGHVGKG